MVECSKIDYQKWAIVLFLALTSTKGISSMRLHRYLGIQQSSA